MNPFAWRWAGLALPLGLVSCAVRSDQRESAEPAATGLTAEPGISASAQAVVLPEAPAVAGGELLAREVVVSGEVQWRAAANHALELVVLERGNSGAGLTRLLFVSSGASYAASSSELAQRLLPQWQGVIEGGQRREKLGNSRKVDAIVLERDLAGAGDGVVIILPDQSNGPPVRLDGPQARAALAGLRQVAGVAAPVAAGNGAEADVLAELEAEQPPRP